MIISHKTASKSQRYNEWRDSQIKAGMGWNGALFQIDSESQRLIAAKALQVLKAQINQQSVPDITWRTQDDQFYTFTPEEFLTFSESVSDHVESIMVQTWAGKDANSQ